MSKPRKVGPSTPRSKMTKDEIKAREWEQSTVWGQGYYAKRLNKGTLAQSMRSRGYDAYRISPQITRKFGKEYRAVYGGVVDPIYSKTHPNGFPKVVWFPMGYVKHHKGLKGGTRTIGTPMSSYGYMGKSELRSQLMLKSPKKKQTTKRKRTT